MRNKPYATKSTGFGVKIHVLYRGGRWNALGKIKQNYSIHKFPFREIKLDMIDYLSIFFFKIFGWTHGLFWGH